MTPVHLVHRSTPIYRWGSRGTPRVVNPSNHHWNCEQILLMVLSSFSFGSVLPKSQVCGLTGSFSYVFVVLNVGFQPTGRRQTPLKTSCGKGYNYHIYNYMTLHLLQEAFTFMTVFDPHNGLGRDEYCYHPLFIDLKWTFIRHLLSPKSWIKGLLSITAL